MDQFLDRRIDDVAGRERLRRARTAVNRQYLSVSSTSRPALGGRISHSAAATLEAVIARIPAQVCPLVGRIVIVNDGSEDQTAAVIDKLKSRYPNIRSRNFAANQGYGAPTF